MTQSGQDTAWFWMADVTKKNLDRQYLSVMRWDKKVAQYMKRHEETFLKTEEYKNQGIGIWHLIKSIILLLVPYAENMICFIPFFMLNNRAVGSQYFDRLDFYLLYVLCLQSYMAASGDFSSFLQRQATVSGRCMTRVD